MALRSKTNRSPGPKPVERVPAPVEEGYGFVQSLGKWIDEAMGHSRDGAVAEDTLRAASERESDQDPEPITPPEPVPDAEETGTRGADPETFETK